METRAYIIAEADRLFSSYGFKSVTMDDIAKHLGMSKKTIYQHFSDKDDLVNILISEKLKAHDCVIKEGFEHAKNAVHEVIFAINSINETLSGINAKLFHDLQKYHPKAWLCFKAFKETRLRDMISKNLERGISEGLYRANLNLEIMTQLRLDQIDLIFYGREQYINSKFTLAQIMTEITEHFLYGICSLKGLKLIETYQQHPISK